jgi:hypothetical protein
MDSIVMSEETESPVKTYLRNDADLRLEQVLV